MHASCRPEVKANPVHLGQKEQSPRGPGELSGEKTMETTTRTVLVVHPGSFCIVSFGSTSLPQTGTKASGSGGKNMERDMTRAEISRATELARVCMVSDYQDCEP